MRFKVVGFSYQTQILQKSVPQHRTTPQFFFKCAPLAPKQQVLNRNVRKHFLQRYEHNLNEICAHLAPK